MIRGCLLAVLVGLVAWFCWAAQNTTTVQAAPVATAGPEDVPARTFQAYLQAVAQAPPECGLSWPVLAGFGAIESSHGTYQGDGVTRTIRPDGVITPGIIGPALDGGSFALIWDTDGGRLDGDTVYDRAVGPTQFIPSTWAGVMGEGFDPQNVDHAALATARKVCHDAGGPVTVPENFTKAAYRYNPSADYVRAVGERVEHYELWVATNPSAGPASTSPAKVDEPTLADIARTMGESGARRWQRVGDQLGRDGADGTLDGAYRWLDPGVEAVLAGLVGDTEERVQAGLRGEPRKSSKGDEIAAKALTWVGRQYRPGIREQCSWFVRQVLHEVGINPGVTAEPIDGWDETGEGMANSYGPDMGELVQDPAGLLPGDVVMFENTYGTWRAGTITHVGIYVGDGQVVDRPTASSPVKLRPLTTFDHFGGAIRIGA